MAVIGVLVVLVMQAKSLGIGGFIYDYFPIMGKGYLPYEKGKLPPVIDYPAWLVIKVFDIILSLFLGLLEVIGTLAKIISLSFRLFGNMTSGATLIVMLFVAM
jgi:F0F1-type ATP synthase membrane subunit a